MNEITVTSRSGRHKATVAEGTVTYWEAAISTTGMLSWRFTRQADFTLPRHVMLDTVERIINQPRIKRGR